MMNDVKKSHNKNLHITHSYGLEFYKSFIINYFINKHSSGELDAD